MRKLEDINTSNMSKFRELTEHLIAMQDTSDFQNSLSYFKGYPEKSLLGDDARAFIYQTIRSILPDRVLEIGTYYAGTAEVIARALWANGKGVLTTIDPFGKLTAEDEIDKWPDGLRERVFFLTVNSMEYFQNVENVQNSESKGFLSKLDLVFIDGNHDYGYVLYDLSMAAKHILPGGIIILDNSELPGVYWAVKHFMRLNPDWKDLGGAMSRYSISDPFEQKSTLIHQFVLIAPIEIFLGESPKCFKSTKFKEQGIRGYKLIFDCNNESGILHVLIHFWSFFVHPSMGNPEQKRIVKKVRLDRNQKECNIEFEPLISERDPEKSFRISEVCLIWQPDKEGSILTMKKEPRLIFTNEIKNMQKNSNNLKSNHMIKIPRYLDEELYMYGLDLLKQERPENKIPSLLKNLSDMKGNDLNEVMKLIDDAYEQAIISADLEAVSKTEINLHDLFLGTGWGISEKDIHGDSWRWLGPSGESVLYLRLKSGQDYLLKSLIHEAKGDSQDRFNVYVNGLLLDKLSLTFEEGRHVFHNCVIPRNVIDMRNGWAKIVFRLDEIDQIGSDTQERLSKQPMRFALARVLCKPFQA